MGQVRSDFSHEGDASFLSVLWAISPPGDCPLAVSMGWMVAERTSGVLAWVQVAVQRVSEGRGGKGSQGDYGCMATQMRGPGSHRSQAAVGEGRRCLRDQSGLQVKPGLGIRGHQR